MLHGRSTDLIGGAGPLEHGDWLVQTVSAVLIGGPYVSSAHAAGVSDVTGQLRTATGRSVLVTEWRPQTRPPFDTQIMDHSCWTGTEHSVRTTGPQSTHEKARRSNRERERKRERERGRDKTSQSKPSWSPTITSYTLPLISSVCLFVFSGLSFLSFSPLQQWRILSDILHLSLMLFLSFLLPPSFLVQPQERRDAPTPYSNPPGTDTRVLGLRRCRVPIRDQC